MTREELFSAFRRPFRRSEGDPGVILGVENRAIVTVDVNRECEDDDVAALAELIVELVNGAEE